jgi:predicted GNAT family acetyltransferase
MEGGGRYFIRLDDGAEAEMTWRRIDAATIAIDHTFTPPAYRGRDVASRLMHHAIAEARATGTRIVPLCAFAVAQFRRHPDWADVLAD